MYVVMWNPENVSKRSQNSDNTVLHADATTYDWLDYGHEMRSFECLYGFKNVLSKYEYHNMPSYKSNEKALSTL